MELTGALSRPEQTHEGSEPHEQQLALEWERLRLERQKLALELRFRRREIVEKRSRSVWKDLLANPVIVAIAGGILTLLTTIVANFYTAAATRESAQQTLQADLIKKFVESPSKDTVRVNLRFLLDAGLLPSYAQAINRYLTTTTAAPQVGGTVDFSPAGEVLSETLRGRLQDAIHGYRDFLQSKGFNNLDDRIQVFIYSKEHQLPAEYSDNNERIHSFYGGNNTLYIHKALSGDASIALREYTHYAFKVSAAPEIVKKTEIESALADYLPATYLGSPIWGANTLVERNIDDTSSHISASTVGWFARGMVWAGALWSCRQKVGRQRVDDLMQGAWQQALPMQQDLVAAKFGEVLTTAPPPVGECFTEEINRRGLPGGTAQ
jgi:hypothetical protein